MPLAERWVIAGGTPVLLRECDGATGTSTLIHLHGFAISGRYMLPTAELLADEFRTFVPDLPGFGRSPRAAGPSTIPRLADHVAAVMDEVGAEKATLVGNSLGCAILGAFAEQHGERLERAVMVSPAGGAHSQPLARAIAQLAIDATREPPRMATVAVPDYMSFGLLGSLRLFQAMTRFPALDALLHLRVPLLAVLGARDPLLAPGSRVRQVAVQLGDRATVAVIRDAAHAINFSHPVELAALIRPFAKGEAVHSEEASRGLSPVALLSEASGPPSP